MEKQDTDRRTDAAELAEILRQYTDVEMLSSVPMDGGHINDTFRVVTADGVFVLQRVQKQMDIVKLEFNFRLYSAACDKSGWGYPAWIKNREGEFFFTDRSGDHWRLYVFIEGEIPELPLSEKKLFAAGQGLARMHTILEGMKEEPKAVYPGLHDLAGYYEAYLRIRNRADLYETSRDPYLEEQIQRGIKKFEQPVEAKRAVIHGDAKLSNMLFSGENVTGFLDYDTVMTGSVAEELADCIRSCCLSEGHLDKRSAEILLDGYVDIVGKHRAKDILRAVPRAFDKICFELALRYYTDVLSGEKRFKEKYNGYRLERARSLITASWKDG